MPDFGQSTRIRFMYGELEIRVEGVQEAIIAIDTMIRRSSNLSNPFQRFQKYWFQDIDESFAAGGEPIEWPALSPAYEGWKSKAYPGQPIMRRSDRLYESLTSQTGDTIWQVGPRHIEFGSRVPYFEFHQTGTSRMPARPVLQISSQAVERLRQMIERYVATGRAE